MGRSPSHPTAETPAARWQFGPYRLTDPCQEELNHAPRKTALVS